METTAHIKAILQRLPDSPGVYQYYDSDGTLLYIGKAKSLKKRVSSYFNKLSHESGKTRVLVRKIADIRFIVVDTELDALLLENNLIKQHQPRYNIALKDDKTYPSIVIKNERFPRVFPTRQIIQDGSEYFGPYASVKTMHALLELIKKLYPIRSCSFNLSEENIRQGKFRVCLEYHIGNCLGPCEGLQPEDEYRQNIDAIREIIRGNHGDALRFLRDKMNAFAAGLEFEKAAMFKQRIDILEKFQAKSTIVHPSIHNTDVFGIVSDKRSSFVNYMRIMNGMIVQGFTSEFKIRLDETEAEVLEYAIVAMRDRFSSTAKEIFVPFPIELDLPEVKVHVPQRGDKKKLLDLSQRNATYYMRDRLKQLEQTNPEAHTQRILETIKADLRLTELPVHIECFDNSNIQGTHPASACVVFKDARPSKSDYRTFNIKTVVGPNDFASMYEVVTRRYKRLRDEGQSLPQLIIIDGGKGQLSSAVDALNDLGLMGKVAIIGIAKRLEEIFFPGDSDPLYLDKRSISLKIIQQLRNEAHRFSLSHHRNRRSKTAFRNSLTDIPGVGKQTAEKLLNTFKSLDEIEQATLDSLKEVVGISLAEKVHSHFLNKD
jgi:excinuclease ABC subunit C